MRLYVSLLLLFAYCTVELAASQKTPEEPLKALDKAEEGYGAEGNSPSVHVEKRQTGGIGAPPRAEYKRLPVYNFGLGKRDPDTGGGHNNEVIESHYEDFSDYDGADAYDEAAQEDEELLNSMAEYYNYDNPGLPHEHDRQTPMDSDKRAREMFNFGLGKRGRNLYEFGLGKKSMKDYSFGLGKKSNGMVQRSPLYQFGLGKRSSSYDFGLGKRKLYEFGLGKRTPNYDFGLGKRSPNYNFGLGKRSPSYDFGLGKRRPYEFGLGKKALYEFGLGKRSPSYDFGLGKRKMYEFGLGKRSPSYDFGLGKRRPYEFGLGKRGRGYEFGLGKRRNYDFGMGKRKPMYEFGLGKRLPMYEFGLGKRSSDFDDEDLDLHDVEEDFDETELEKRNPGYRPSRLRSEFNFGLGKRATDDIDSDENSNRK